MLDELPGKLIEEGIDPFAAFADILRAADLRIGNLECVVGTTGAARDKFYTFRATPASCPYLSVISAHSPWPTIILVTLAPWRLRKCLTLDRERILYFGGGRTLSEAHAPLLFERKGLRIALLGSISPARSFEADVDKPGIAWSDDEQVQADIKNARTRYKADIVITFMHWGWEREPFAKRQRQLAHLMIESGADAVIGGHATSHKTSNIITESRFFIAWGILSSTASAIKTITPGGCCDWSWTRRCPPVEELHSGNRPQRYPAPRSA